MRKVKSKETENLEIKERYRKENQMSDYDNAKEGEYYTGQDKYYDNANEADYYAQTSQKEYN